MQAVECSFHDQAVLTELRKLLAALYPTEVDQRRLATEAKLVTGAIPLGSSAFNNWHHILQHARHNRRVEAHNLRVDDMNASARTLNGDNADLQVTCGSRSYYPRDRDGILIERGQLR